VERLPYHRPPEGQERHLAEPLGPPLEVGDPLLPLPGRERRQHLLHVLADYVVDRPQLLGAVRRGATVEDPHLCL
jgi:hypothetical protein